MRFSANRISPWTYLYKEKMDQKVTSREIQHLSIQHFILSSLFFFYVLNVFIWMVIL